MSTRLDTDPELLDLVRYADPMLDPRVRADAGLDTESALRLLAHELDRPPSPRRRRRTALRTAALAGAVAAAAFVVANVASTGNGSAVSPAQAKTMIRHARAALAAALLYPPAAVVEEDTVDTDTAPDGSTNTSEAHQWWTTSPPYENREIIVQNGKVQWEQTTVNGRLELYDPATNTVYVPPASAPQQAGGDDPNVTTALAGVHYLLGQHSAIGRVTVNPNAVFDGATAIEFTFDGGRFRYWASPGDYRPLQSEDRQTPLPGGQNGVRIARYPIERVLTGAAASPRLLSLQAQHPGATVDHSSADYQATYLRLFHAPMNPNAVASPRRRTS
jgi:hypothetical protein